MTGSELPVTASVPALELLGRAAAGRLRDVAAAVHRLDGMSPRGVGESAAPTREDVRAMVLRALRLAGESDNARILRAVADGKCQVSQLVGFTGHSRLVLWDLIGDLVGVGLLEREPLRDEVALTSAGAALLLLVDELVAAGDHP